MNHSKRAAPQFQGAVFSITQMSFGEILQFEPPLGSHELDCLINAFIPGPGPLSSKIADLTIDFYNTVNASILPGPVSRLYHVPQSVGWLPAGSSTPLATGSAVLTPGFAPAAGAKRARKDESPAPAFERQPGFSILTKDGVDITEYASRGPKTKKQRDEAAFMRKLGSCPACKKKKIKCDPSHQRPNGSAGSTPVSATASSGEARTSISPQSSLDHSFNGSPVTANLLSTGLVAHTGEHFAPVSAAKLALSPSDFAFDMQVGTGMFSFDDDLPSLWEDFDQSLMGLGMDFPIFPNGDAWNASLYAQDFSNPPHNPLPTTSTLQPTFKAYPTTTTSPSSTQGEQYVEDSQPGTRPSAQSIPDLPRTTADINFDDWVNSSDLQIPIAAAGCPRHDPKSRRGTGVHLATLEIDHLSDTFVEDPHTSDGQSQRLRQSPHSLSELMSPRVLQDHRQEPGVVNSVEYQMPTTLFGVDLASENTHDDGTVGNSRPKDQDMLALATNLPTGSSLRQQQPTLGLPALTTNGRHLAYTGGNATMGESYVRLASTKLESSSSAGISSQNALRSSLDSRPGANIDATRSLHLLENDPASQVAASRSESLTHLDGFGSILRSVMLSQSAVITNRVTAASANEEGSRSDGVMVVNSGLPQSDERYTSPTPGGP